MTTRCWGCVLAAGLMLVIGVFRDLPTLTVPGLALLLWLGWEGLLFRMRVRLLLRRLRLERTVCEEGRPISTLFAGRDYEVRLTLRLEGRGRFPFVGIADPVPFAMQHREGSTQADGELSSKTPLTLSYRVHCPLAGVARFEGVRLELSDLQGFFVHVGFLRDPGFWPILPGVIVHRGGGPTLKRHNDLPPPGIHRLRQPGSSSELLDLRDYQPGDPPRLIAWKASARRDRLMTREFENEVPIRCTLFVDASSSVRVHAPASATQPTSSTTDSVGSKASALASLRPLDRIIDLAAGIISHSASVRDLIGLCVFDEQSSQEIRPERSPAHRNRLLMQLAHTAAGGPVAARVDPDELLMVAYALAMEVYPDLLHHDCNRMPAWLTWVVGFPAFTPHRRGLLNRLHRRKSRLLLVLTTLLPLGLLLTNVTIALLGMAPEWAMSLLGGLFFFGTPLAVLVGWVLFLFSVLISSRLRRRAAWRKRLAALLALRASQGVGSAGLLAAMLEDDDLFSLHLQRFLAEHQVPCAWPLYDSRGAYLFATPDKVTVLAKVLTAAVARGRDNELFVLLVDLLELDEHLDPLLRAVRVALARHHQVLLLCPWPEDVPAPGQPTASQVVWGTSLTVRDVPALVRSLTEERLRSAYERIRRVFVGLGVPVVCAVGHEPVSVVLERMERLRSSRISALPGQR